MLAVKLPSKLVMAVGGLGVVLGALAFPRFKSSLTYLPVKAAIQQYTTDKQIPAAALPRLIARAKASIAADDQVEYWEGLSLMYYLQYLHHQQQQVPAQVDTAALKAALAATETVLIRTPVKPALWWQLALLRKRLNHPPPSIIKALELSILTGRFDRGLMIARLSLSLLYHPQFDAEGQSIVRDQLKLAWQFEPEKLLALLKSDAYYMTAVQALLGLYEADLLKQLRVALDSPS